MYLGSWIWVKNPVKHAKRQITKCQKNAEKKSQNVKCKNVKIIVEKMSFFTFCIFLYSKKNVESQNIELRNAKNDVQWPTVEK